VLGSLLTLILTGCTAASTYQVEFPPPDNAKAHPPGKVLVVLSAAPTQTLADSSQRETGYFLNEFYEPYHALLDAGYDVVIATPGGRPPALDPESLKEKYWDDPPHDLAQARTFVETHPDMSSPLSLEDVATRPNDFQALIVPGGQGVMVDLLDDQHLHALLRAFEHDHRPVGLICHAPAILARMQNGTSNTFSDRRVTSVSGIEEWYIETFVMGADAQVRDIGGLLDDAGFRHDAAFPGSSHALRDCNLVTSQNPFSGDDFNALFLQALIDWRQGGRCVPRHQG